MRDAIAVRTTLEIDDDVLMAAKEIALAHGLTAGKVISGLARKGLEGPKKTARVRNGVPVLPARPGEAPRTMALVNELRDQE
jgi:hypothetical protein